MLAHIMGLVRMPLDNPTAGCEQRRHDPVALFVVRAALPEGYQGNRRGFLWSGARGATRPAKIRKRT